MKTKKNGMKIVVLTLILSVAWFCFYSAFTESYFIGSVSVNIRGKDLEERPVTEYSIKCLKNNLACENKVAQSKEEKKDGEYPIKIDTKKCKSQDQYTIKIVLPTEQSPMTQEHTWEIIVPMKIEKYSTKNHDIAINITLFQNEGRWYTEMDCFMDGKGYQCTYSQVQPVSDETKNKIILE